MNRRELRAAMKRQRDETRARMRALEAEANAALANNPAIRRAKRRRRIKQAITIAVLLLLLLLIRCDGPPGEAPPVTKAVVDAGVEVKKPPVKLAKRPKVPVKSKAVERPGFEPPDRAPARWVDEFRLQVAARSPRLASCFNGTDRPGALRWTALVSRQTGAVGDFDFEAMGNAGLSRDQLECLTDVLSSPGYRLDTETEEGLPERVSLVLEF